MKRRVSLSLAISISMLLLLIKASNSAACGTSSATITNLPPVPGAAYQVFDLNEAGQLTGFFFVSGEHPSHAFFYDAGNLTDLGTLGGSTSEGNWLNASGQVVGKSTLPGDIQSHAFLLSSGTLLDLGTLGGPNSTATAINDPGLVIGDSDLPGGLGTSAFIYSNGVMTSLGNLGSNFSSAFALNNNGLVVGEAGVSNGAVHAFAYVGGTLSDVGTLGGTYSSAFAVNDAGEVVGESSISNSDVHGFVQVGGTLTDVGTFGGTYSSTYLVNSNGLAVGIANTAGDAETHGFVYSNGTLTDLGTLGGSFSFPYGLNNKGQVVGESGLASGGSHAFLWDNGTLTDLNTLLPTNSGWELFTPVYINDAGRVVGIGNLAGVSQWFIMDLASANGTPVAVAGPDQTVDCQAQVTLDGSRSSDPDDDALSFAWIANGNTLGTNPVITVSLPIGTNVVTLTVTDSCGASAQTNLTVIVADTTPPTGSCPTAVTASADANCQAPVPNLVPQVVASDNCTPAQSLVITQSPPAGTLLGLGSHPITMTVTDLSGNSSSCAVLFTVVDTTPPAILSTPAPFTLSAGPNCQAQVPDLLPNFVAADSCTPANQLVKSQNPPAGTLVGVGSYSITLTATDAAGNSSSASVAFKVADTTPPTFLSTPGPFNVSADANCQGAVPNVLSSVLVADNCTPASQLLLVQNPPAGTVLPSGAYSITVTATDLAGNSSSVTIPLQIADTTPPQILSSPAVLTVSADSNCQGAVPNVLARVLATDNCTAASQLVLSQNPAAGTVLPRGNYSVVVTVTDAAGNSTSQSIPLAIVDKQPPVFLSLVANPSELTPPNHQLDTVTVSALVKDNCDAAPLTKIVSVTCNEPVTPNEIQITGALTVKLAATKPSSGNARIYTITVQSTDASGNSSTSQVTVTVYKSGSGGSGTGTGTSTKGTRTTTHHKRH
jgi:probable HAF family extracellular repeat protein